MAEPIKGKGAKPRPQRKADRTQRKMPTRSFAASPWARLQKETRQRHELRRPLIEILQKRLDARVYTYFTSFNNWEGQVSDDHAEMLENLLAAEHDGSKLVLVVNSPGGQALAAERIVNVCRAYSSGQFDTLVPHMAKSAATMICFGSNAIHMSRTSELGPVDPQLMYKREGAKDAAWISAAEYIRSYVKLMKGAASGKAQRIEPHLLQLNKFDARHIEQLISHQDLSEDISIRLLQAGMMKGQTRATVRRHIAPFLVQRQKSAHGRMINVVEAQKAHLNVAEIPLDSELWRAVWALYVPSDWCVSRESSVLIESALSSVGR